MTTQQNFLKPLQEISMYLMDQNPIGFLIVFTLKFGYMHSQCKYKDKNI